MSEPLMESYEIKSEDKELHCINVILEVLERHLTNKGEVTSEQHEEMLSRQRMRVASYVCERMANKPNN